MDVSLSPEQKYSLATSRLELQNGWSGQKLQKLLTEGKTVKYHWMTAPTGKPHIGYFIPLIKFADFIRAGGEVTVEYLDSYAFLVNYRFPWNQVQSRSVYYRALITAALKAAGIPMSKVSMADMSSYQGNPKFMVDFWRLCALCSQQDCKDTGAEVGASTMLSPLLTPLLQELGLEYLGSDVEFGGTDQRGIFNLGEQFLPELGYEKRVHVMNELLPSLVGGKMSSSDPDHTKIMFLDDATAVRDKISGANCPARIVAGNGILPIVKHILIPVSEIQMLGLGIEMNGHGAPRAERKGPFAAKGAPGGTLFSVSAEDGSYRHYKVYEDLEKGFVEGVIGPQALKESVTVALNHLLGPIRSMYSADELWKAADRNGYPCD